MKYIAAWVAAVATLVPMNVRAAEARAALPVDFDATVTALMGDWSIPGLAVAVVRADGEPVIRTYGKRQWNRPEAITADTMFGIASNTKQFISAAIALLAQEGRLSFDDPVVKHLPEFRVRDAWVTRNATIRDLLSHRTGIASYNDWLEEVAAVDEQKLVAMLAEHGQSIPFRSGAEYSSYTFVVLARIIERVSGQPWGDFLHERIWRPLGMNHMAAHADEFAPKQNVLPTGDGWVQGVPQGLDALKPGVDVAAPHVQWEAFYQGKAFYDPRELENRTAHFHRTAIDAGQSVFASIGDLATWARLLVRGGGKVLEPATLRQMLTLQSLTGVEWPHAPDARSELSLDEVGYGLGFAQYRRGQRVLYGHSGGELGFSSLFIVDPDAGFAVIVLTNNLTHSWGAADALVQTVLDWQYQTPARDWSRQAIDENRARVAGNMARASALWKSAPLSKSAAPKTEAIVGRYESPVVGPLIIEKRATGLFASTGPAYDIELRHVNGNIYHGIAVSTLRSSMVLTFDIDVIGKVQGLRMGWASDIGHPEYDFLYTRQPKP